MIAVKATGADLLALMDDPEMPGFGIVTTENVNVINEWPHVISLVDVYGKVWAVAGYLQDENQDWEAFIFIDRNAGQHKLNIVKICKSHLESAPFPVYAKVAQCFGRGHKFIRVLGFKETAPCSAQNREGQNEYVRYDYFKGD